MHNLKILPKYFADVKSGIKTFEIRFNDRNYKVGDTLILREWTPEEGYTGNVLQKEVVYLLDDSQYCKEGFVILGIK